MERATHPKTHNFADTQHQTSPGTVLSLPRADLPQSRMSGAPPPENEPPRAASETTAVRITPGGHVWRAPFDWAPQKWGSSARIRDGFTRHYNLICLALTLIRMNGAAAQFRQSSRPTDSTWRRRGGRGRKGRGCNLYDRWTWGGGEGERVNRGSFDGGLAEEVAIEEGFSGGTRQNTLFANKSCG